MKRVLLNAQAAPPRGAYSQGWRAGDFVFVSGQVPVDPASGHPVQGPFRQQVIQTLRNIEAVLAAEGATLKDVVKFTVIVQDLGTFDELNAGFRELMSDPLPARTTFKGDLRGVSLEIDAIAFIGPTKGERT